MMKLFMNADSMKKHEKMSSIKTPSDETKQKKKTKFLFCSVWSILKDTPKNKSS